MKVKIPRGTLTRADGNVEVVVATPYGITAPLIVPQVASPADNEVSGYRFTPQTTLTGTYKVEMAGDVTISGLSTHSGNQQPNIIAPNRLFLRFEATLSTGGAGPESLGPLPAIPLDVANRRTTVKVADIASRLAPLLKNKVRDREAVIILTGKLSPADTFKDIVNVDNVIRIDLRPGKQ
jgi:hypothetical protein